MGVRLRTAASGGTIAEREAALRKKRSKSPLRDRNAENVKTDDVCDIDKRLNSLKAFLREAKSKPL